MVMNITMVLNIIKIYEDYNNNEAYIEDYKDYNDDQDNNDAKPYNDDEDALISSQVFIIF